MSINDGNNPFNSRYPDPYSGRNHRNHHRRDHTDRNHSGFGDIPTTRRTEDVAQVQRNADRNGDGQTTRKELDRYSNKVRDDLFRSVFDYIFKGQQSPQMADRMKELHKQWETTQDLKKNFDKFAGQDGRARGISEQDVRRTAGKDGNFGDISFLDLMPGVDVFSKGKNPWGLELDPSRNPNHFSPFNQVNNFNVRITGANMP